MLRTQISLTDEQRRLLDAESARTGRSISALIRQAVDAAYGTQRSVEKDVANMRRAFGAWRTHELGGEAWVEQVRSGERLRPVR